MIYVFLCDGGFSFGWGFVLVFSFGFGGFFFGERSWVCLNPSLIGT
jgi:hypothetical protein